MARLTLTPWGREALTADDRAEIAASLPVRYAVLIGAGRNRGSWTCRIWRVDELVATIQRFPNPMSAFRAALRLVEPLSLVWCSSCDQPAIGERDGRAWCRSHRHEPQEVIAA